MEISKIYIASAIFCFLIGIYMMIIYVTIRDVDFWHMALISATVSSISGYNIVKGD